MGCGQSVSKSKVSTKRLALPLSMIKGHADVVVIGSGYGGSTAACRAARMGLQVCVLEKGKEWPVGSFPETSLEGFKELQTNCPLPGVENKTLSHRSKLYNLVVNKDIMVFQGCGLGGGSLINGNVCMLPRDEVFLQSVWPAEFREEWKTTRLAEDVKSATEMLRPTTYPDPDGQYPVLPKVKLFSKVGASTASIADIEDYKSPKERKVGKFSKIPINVNFVYQKENHVGVEQFSCTNCGNCCSGCNIGAKNTLYMNYLPDAANHGAEIFTEVEVLYLEQIEKKKEGKEGKEEKKDEQKMETGNWLVHYRSLITGVEKIITAKYVFLGAGSLGTTEILQRSAKKGLSLSLMLGKKFSGNGDAFAFSFDGKEESSSLGRDKKSMSKLMIAPSPGACITSLLDFRGHDNLADDFVVEDCAIPNFLSSAFKGMLTLSLLPHSLKEAGEAAFETSAIDKTCPLLIMSQDSATGIISLVDDDEKNVKGISISWPGIGREESFRHVNVAAKKISKVLGGTFVPDPLWHDALGKKLITVHPLGGAGMGQNKNRGVVAHTGQVFSARRGESATTVYENLFVVDGSCVPLSLGINPLLTITMLAERTMRLFQKNQEKVKFTE